MRSRHNVRAASLSEFHIYLGAIGRGEGQSILAANESFAFEAEAERNRFGPNSVPLLSEDPRPFLGGSHHKNRSDQ